MRAALFAVTFLALSPVQASGQEKEMPKPPETALGASQAELVSAPLSLQELQDISGGDAVIVEALTTQNLTATVSENTIAAQSIETGDVTFAENSLNFHGIGNYVINTGNNNVLQGSLSVTIQSGPASP
jgi:hypothetical protein